METELIKAASRRLAELTAEERDSILLDLANAIERSVPSLLSANKRDLKRMERENPLYDRLLLTEDRLRGIAADTRNVAALPSPLGKKLIEKTLPNGLRLTRVAVPFGVIGVIYEARPNVTIDVASLCLKAGSACILKGGSDAQESNVALADLIQTVLFEHGLDPATVTLLPATREATAELLHARGTVDLIIPRGSSNLINYVREESTVPVIETGAGVVHAYFDKDGDLEKGKRIIENAKCRRVSVCNALDTLLVHKDREGDLEQLLAPMKDRVTIHTDEYGREWMSYDMSVKIVESLEAAMSHIRKYGSGHSECIITENEETAERFLNGVDAACVYHNAPTSFTDGAQFGLGAEIGISTQKLHARGPMALNEICTYKWVIRGDGQTRK